MPIRSPSLHRAHGTISPEAMAAAEVHERLTAYTTTRKVELLDEDELRKRFPDEAARTIWARYDNKYSHRIITSRVPSASKHKETL